MSILFCLIQVKILPPRQLYHPVLPYSSNGKLKFPLCRQCAALESQESCRCSDEQRCLTGTWCTPEIEKAIEKGYTIVKIYEVYHWPKSAQHGPSSEGLFTDFINTFLKIKQESSGWPEWCGEDADKRDEYIRSYYNNEGVELDPDQIAHNPGRRSLAKLILNSFWGKYGQRNNLKQSKYVHDQADLLSQLLDERKDIGDFHILNVDTCMLSYKMHNEFVEECPTSNVAIAAFTTCWARLRLYGVLEQLDTRCLYFDTDSVIFVEKKNDPNPIAIGDFLGQLTDELPSGHHISTFIGAGPKNYAYKVSNGDEVLKVRGFTLNYRNAQVLNYDSVRELLLNRPKDTMTVPECNKIVRDPVTQTLFNRPEAKTYSVVYTKRRLVDNMDTVPFGYADSV